MVTRDEFARSLVTRNAEIEAGIIRAFRLLAPHEECPHEPAKVLIVNRDTPESGIIPLAFGPDERNPYPYVIVEVTENELERLRRGELTLPDGWIIGEEIASG